MKQIIEQAKGPAGGKRRWARLTRKKQVGVILLLMLSSSVAAYAFWSTTGSGSGNTQASSNVTSTATAAVSPGVDSDLWPGNTTAAALQFTVDNPNPYDITFTSASVGTITGTIDCPDTEFEAITGSITLSTPLAVPAGSSAVAGTVPGAIKLLNLTTNQDDCQGATISATITLTGTQDQ
ncbi:MAG: hypothetical protein WD602_05240 [Actinomycetota bacterium]